MYLVAAEGAVVHRGLLTIPVMVVEEEVMEPKKIILYQKVMPYTLL
nr:MAG TPA: hypothetical protein [Caudoviricetes sp.]